MELQKLCLAGVVMLAVLPQASAQEQPSAQAEVLKELRELALMHWKTGMFRKSENMNERLPS